MQYRIGGSAGEGNTFYTVVQRTAILTARESSMLAQTVSLDTSLMGAQGTSFNKVNLNAVNFSDFTSNTDNPPAAAAGVNPTNQPIGVTVAPRSVTVYLDKYYNVTNSINHAGLLGEEFGGAYGELLNQTVNGTFAGGFKSTTGNTLQTGDTRHVTQIGRQTVAAADGVVAALPAFGTILNNARVRKSGRVFSFNPSVGERIRDDLTGSAVTADGGKPSMLGEAILGSGMLPNVHGFMLVECADVTAILGAVYVDTAITLAVKLGLEIITGLMPGGQSKYYTADCMIGASVTSPSRGFSVSLPLT